MAIETYVHDKYFENNFQYVSDVKLDLRATLTNARWRYASFFKCTPLQSERVST